jgi:hypothetical protein
MWSRAGRRGWNAHPRKIATCALTLQGSRTVGAVIPFTPPEVVLIVQQPARAV